MFSDLGYPTLENLFHLTGKKAVVVGGAQGLGRMSARALAAAGAQVVVADIDAGGASHTCAAIEAAGGVATSANVDVRSQSSVNELCRLSGAIDILVVTVGTNVRKLIVDLKVDDFDRVVDVNLRGTYRLLQAYGGLMAEAGGGSIITFASFRAMMVEPGQSVYSATKAGVLQFSRTLAAELGPQNVRVNSIAPGPFATNLTQQISSDPVWGEAYAQRTALRRWGREEEIAGPVVYLASDASSYVTGTLHLVDAGWTAVDGRFDPPL